MLDLKFINYINAMYSTTEQNVVCVYPVDLW